MRFPVGFALCWLQIENAQHFGGGESRGARDVEKDRTREHVIARDGMAAPVEVAYF
jgi:hypothetical protein